MTGRANILGRIRERLQTSAREAGAEERLSQPPLGPRPERATGDADTLIQRFIERAEAAAAEVIELAPAADLGAAVAEAVGQDTSAASVVADEDLCAELGERAVCRPAAADDELAVSHAFCGVAETGTLVLRSGAGRPTTAAFVPPLHVVVLQRDTIVGAYEDAWGRLRAAGPMPRTVNWITGPSRSADIEQTLNMGAHGPIRLVILLR